MIKYLFIVLTFCSCMNSKVSNYDHPIETSFYYADLPTKPGIHVAIDGGSTKDGKSFTVPTHKDISKIIVRLSNLHKSKIIITDLRQNDFAIDLLMYDNNNEEFELIGRGGAIAFYPRDKFISVKAAHFLEYEGKNYVCGCSMHSFAVKLTEEDDPLKFDDDISRIEAEFELSFKYQTLNDGLWYSHSQKIKVTFIPQEAPKPLPQKPIDTSVELDFL